MLPAYADASWHDVEANTIVMCHSRSPRQFSSSVHITDSRPPLASVAPEFTLPTIVQPSAPRCLSQVQKPLLETSRKGYLAAMSASSYSYVSMLQRFGPIMNPGGAAISLTYLASERVIPGYGGGMSSAKAALESDTRVLAWEAGRKVRVATRREGSSSMLGGRGL